MPPRFVIFDVYATQAPLELGLPRDAAERLAVELDRSGEPRVAGQLRYSLVHDAPVTFDDDREREIVAEALERMVTGGDKDETIAMLAYQERRGVTVFGDPPPAKSCPECLSEDLPIAATRCRYCGSSI